MSNEDENNRGFKGVGDLFKKPAAGKPKDEFDYLDQPVLNRRQPGTQSTAETKSTNSASSATSGNTDNNVNVSQNKPNEPKGILFPLLIVVGIIIFISFVISSMDSSRPTQEYAQESVPLASSAPVPPPEPKPAYVVTELANVRIAGSPQAEVVAQLPQWSVISVIGGDDKWSQISYTTESGTGNGYMLNQLFTFGTQQDARNAYCDLAGSVRPYSGEVLSQVSTGSHSITVNGGDRDALIKLRRNGTTALSFYVRANETGKVANVADGQYQVMFATGNDFSRKCLEFMTDMSVIADPNILALQTTTESTYEGVTTYYATMEYTLTRQANGNFRPQNLDPSAFKE